MYDETETDPLINTNKDIFVTGSLLTDPNHQHKLEVSISTLFGARGLYTYIPGYSFSRMINIEWKVWELGVDVTNEYYNIEFEATINIGYTPIEVELYDYTVEYYDGLHHSLYENVEGGIYGVLAEQGVEYDYVKFAETLDTPDHAWQDLPLKKINAGKHEIAIWIHLDGRPEYRTTVILEILPATLVVDVFEPEYQDDCYDGLEHNVTYSVRAKSVVEGETYEINAFHDVPYIRYYKTSEYDKNVLVDFYENKFSVDADLFTQGLESYVDAGEYYAMVYFSKPAPMNYYASLTTYTFTYEWRPIEVYVPGTSEASPQTYSAIYNGYKYNIPIINPTFNETDLLPGHTIPAMSR